MVVFGVSPKAARGCLTVLVRCPHCGEQIVVGSLGRKPLNHSVLEVCDALQRSTTAKQAAEIVGSSRPYIYKVLKANGLKVRDYLTKGVNSSKQSEKHLAEKR